MKRFYRRHLWLLLPVLIFLAAARPSTAAPEGQLPEDWDIPGGHIYTQAAGGMGGFTVLDDGQARFWSEFQRLGGLQNVGYPISRRFMYDGFVTQAFQKLVLQWRPEVNQAWPLNVFDELSRRGFDDRLYHARQTPYPLQNFDPPGATWEQIVRNRQALLDAAPAMRVRYFAAPDPLNVYGLPVSRVEDMGNHYALRTQRAVFQLWKEDVPWARRFQVTVANGGDIAKELGWLFGPALQPEPLPGPPTEQWAVLQLLVGAGSPGPLWALQSRQFTPTPEYRLMISGDYGESWTDFGPLPVRDECLNGVDIDYATPTTLYASTCEGLYRWEPGRWNRISSQVTYRVVVEYQNPSELWAITSAAGGPIIHSKDGGQTWTSASNGLIHFGSIASLGIDPRDNDPLYAIIGPRFAGSYLRRGTPDGQWVTMPGPENDAYTIETGMTIDGQNGHLYVTRPSDSTLWRSPNPDAPNLSEVRWERVHQFNEDLLPRLLASGWSPQGLALYVNLSQKSGHNIVPLLYRSLDGGQTWSQIVIP